jgi:hypothetical protein
MGNACHPMMETFDWHMGCATCTPLKKQIATNNKLSTIVVWCVKQ